MLAGRLAATDPFEIVPPRSHGAGSTQEQDMLVLVGRDGRLALDGETLDETGLGFAVAARLAEDDNARVRQKADGHAEAKPVTPATEQAARIEPPEIRTAPATTVRAQTVTATEAVPEKRCPSKRCPPKP